jgi:hypothetical protein
LAPRRVRWQGDSGHPAFALRASVRLFKIAPGDLVSLHAGVAARAEERQKLERRCRHISQPSVAEKPLSLTPNGNARYPLKTPYRDGTTHVIFEPLEWVAPLRVHHPSGAPQAGSMGNVPPVISLLAAGCQAVLNRVSKKRDED